MAEVILPVSTTKRKYESRYELLECPVCFDLPRSGPLFGCKNGHIFCNPCRNHLISSQNLCPVCRSKDISCRNLIAEKLLVELLDENNVQFSCQFGVYDCKFRGDRQQIEKHESSCAFRCIECPSVQLGSCNWKGPLKNLLKHVVVNKCAQVLKTTAQTNSFSSSVCDFTEENSVLKRNTQTCWKPVLLFSPLTVAFLIYLNIFRDKNGIWSLNAKSYAPKSIIDSLFVEINVFSSRSGDLPFKVFNFVGRINPVGSSEKEVRDSGETVLLSDGQVKSLGSEGNKLFQYSAKILRRRPKKHVIQES